GNTPSAALDQMLAEIRESAQKEMDTASAKDEGTRYNVSIFNYFGKYAEDKDAAITFRDRHLLPAIEAGRRINLDFRDVETAPHSFLNALLATPIKRLGAKAYQWIKVHNAPGPIHEIIDGILEDNVPRF
ncbi:MAG: STAS-like domain-containing protein, partial [Candidatus Angelobacter sp.]